MGTQSGLSSQVSAWYRWYEDNVEGKRADCDEVWMAKHSLQLFMNFARNF